METAVVHIDSIAAGGDGVGRTDGLVVFVPHTAPGDDAEVELERKGRLARGKLVRLIQRSPDRVDPRCEHYTADRCGGCQIQHMRYDAQLRVKGAIIRDALHHLGKREVGPLQVQPSPAEWHYRSKLTLALRRQGDRWIGGLHPFDDPVAVFELRDCLITDRRVLATWKDILAAGELLPTERALRGSVRFEGESATLVLEGGRQWTTAAELGRRVPSLGAIWWEPAGTKRRLVFDRRQDRAPSAAFGQVNPAMAAILRAYVIERAMAYNPATAVDGYAGAGATAIPLAERGVAVTAIELDPSAADWTRTHLPPRSRSLRARVEDVLPNALPADVVILNPPRAGLEPRVTDALTRTRPRPRAVIYVSCDPATLARDLTRLNGFAIRTVTGFDMFPQTSHVETVCELVPETV